MNAFEKLLVISKENTVMLLENGTESYTASGQRE